MKFPPFVAPGKPVFLFILLAVLISFTSKASFSQSESQIADSMLVEEDSLAIILRAVHTPKPPTNVSVIDAPDDAGGAVDIMWELSADDMNGTELDEFQPNKVEKYRILRADAIDGQPGEFTEIGLTPAGATSFRDGNAAEGGTFYYKVAAVNDLKDDIDKLLRQTADTKELWILGEVLKTGNTELSLESETVGPVSPSAQWFDMRRINVFFAVLLLCFFIVFYISRAKAGKTIFIRKIAGLEAVDEAVGRATEMGKKIFYVPGTQDMDNVQTIAGVTILGRVAELAAQYDTWLEVPVSRSLVMVTAREVVKEAYVRVGRADSYNDNQVHYLTDDQFGYAAAIDGMVVRERPATIFLMGSFYAESLILAETGNSVGAIQIAGTGQPSQLPFFVAACDYTLIGEELFAASAYLSKEPKQLGSLKGQDIGKGIILVAIVIGILLETFHIWKFSKLFTVID